MKKKTLINGTKVIKRYSFPIFFTALLALCLAAIPAVCYFFPLLNVSGDVSIELKGLDVLKCSVAMVKKDLVNADLINLLDELGSHNKLVNTLYPIALTILGALLGLVCVFAIIEFVSAIVLITSGRIKNFKSCYRTSWWIFVFMGLFTLVSYGIKFVVEYIAKQLEVNYVINQGLYYVYILLGVSFLAMLILGITYKAAFKNRILAPKKKEQNDVQLEDKTNENHGNFNQVNDIDNSIKEIKESMYAKDTSIQNITIPLGIKKIGKSAFANCINAEAIFIPNTVCIICSNAFFNCKKVTKIDYAGYKKDWKHIKRGSNWLANAGTTTVYCRDGAIIVNPYR